MRPREFILRRMRNRIPRTRLGLALAGGTLGGLAILTILVGLTFLDLPDVDSLKEGHFVESSKILDREGNLLYEVHGEERRTLVGLEEMPTCVRDATLAAEDDKFYSHMGFRPTAILRAAVTNVLHGTSAGGSTITQQLVKNAILSSEKTYTRKLRELILAVRVELHFSKDDILEMYLNQIPYGSNAYGIEAAAETFFRKPASELQLHECALLAALPQRPTFFSPYGNNVPRLLERKDWILDRMASLGYVDESDADAAKLAKLTVYPFTERMTAPHFVMWVRDLVTEKFGEDIWERGGLTITTTLDPAMYEAARDAIAWRAPHNASAWGASNEALVAIRPQTGEVLAMVGSKDYFDATIDGNVNVALRPRQPGSSFKPFVYAAAIERGLVTPATVLYDVPTTFPTPDATEKFYDPENYDGEFHGPVSIRSALAMSLNIPAVKVLQLVGLEDAITFAKKFGFEGFNEPWKYGLSFVLGGAEVRLLDLVSAYGVFANEGILHSPVAILKIQDSAGRILEEFDPTSPGAGTSVISPELAYLMSSILSDNVARTPIFGAGSWLQLGGRPVAAKSGTTQNFRDGWTVGYTPSLVAGVWAGNNDNTEMKKDASGTSVAGSIWQRFMNVALRGEPTEQFRAPAGIRAVNVSTLSGKLVGPLTPPSRVRTEVFLKDFVPRERDDRVVGVEVDRVSGGKATIFTPQATRETWVTERHAEINPSWRSWQQPVAEWAASHTQLTDADLASLGELLAMPVRRAPGGRMPTAEDSVHTEQSASSDPPRVDVSSVSLGEAGGPMVVTGEISPGGAPVTLAELFVDGVSAGSQTLRCETESSGEGSGRDALQRVSTCSVRFETQPAPDTETPKLIEILVTDDARNAARGTRRM